MKKTYPYYVLSVLNDSSIYVVKRESPFKEDWFDLTKDGQWIQWNTNNRKTEFNSLKAIKEILQNNYIWRSIILNGLL